MEPLLFFDSTLCMRLAAALLHFIWQGLLVAIVAVIFARFLGRSSRVRYNIYMFSLMAMVFCVMGTYAFLDDNSGSYDTQIPANPSVLSESTGLQESEAVLGSRNEAMENDSRLPSEESSKIEATKAPALDVSPIKQGSWNWQILAPYVVAIYWLGVMAMFGRLVIALAGGKRLQRISLAMDDPNILSALIRQSHALQIRFTPAIACCQHVVVPTVVGILRPMILLPVSFGTGLTGEQIEMLLAHELAHIRRFDPLWNIIQRVIEALLFFHPATWFISHRIRVEREHCCDDIVLAGGAAGTAYASCLVDMAERSLQSLSGRLVLEATGPNKTSSHLRVRVLRLLGISTQEPIRLSRSWPVMLLAVLMLPGFVWLTGPTENALASSDSIESNGETIIVQAGESLQTVIDLTAPGSVLKLDPGEYEGPVRIEKPLTIIGAGWDKTTIRMDYSDGAKQYKSLIEEAMKEAQQAASVQEQQMIRAKYESMLKTMQTTNVVSIVGTEDVAICNLKLTMPGSAEEGRVMRIPIVNLNNAKGSVVECAIVGTPGDGIQIINNSNVTIEKSLIAAAWGTGIAVSNSSKVLITDCDIRNCYHRCITIGRGCDETIVRRCRISGSAWHGIRYDSAAPLITGNLLFDHARFGIYASGQTAAVVRENVFFTNEMAGMSCWFNNRDVIEGNTFVGNERSGLEILGTSDPLVQGNIFYDNPVGITLGNIAGQGESRISNGTVNLSNNVFWQNDRNVEWSRPGEDGQAVVEEIIPSQQEGNLEVDPGFVNPMARDFSLPADSEARSISAGTVEPLPFTNPWPLQAEEQAIIPTGDTRGSRQWTPPVSRVSIEETIMFAADQSRSRGTIQGRIVNAATGQPIVGAYVGTGNFGDSGGSNYSRHREKGYHASGRTDTEGCFVLENLAFVEDDQWLAYHPLIVTHPEYVSYEEKIVLTRNEPDIEVKVQLRPAAVLEVKIVDEAGKPEQGTWVYRLERLDGKRFIPIGKDPHMSSFASSVWMEMPDLRKRGLSEGFTFRALDTGDYRIDVMQVSLVANPTPQNIWAPVVRYRGGVDSIHIEAGQARTVEIRPVQNDTRLIVTMPEITFNHPQIPTMVLLSRNMGLLVWDSDKAYSLEDARLGRLQKQSLFYTMAQQKEFVFENFAPGQYAVFAGPAVAMNAALVTLQSGQEVNATVRPVDVKEAAWVGVHLFDRWIGLDKRVYTAQEICEIITAAVQANPTVVCDPAIQNEKVNLPAGTMPIWDLIEKVHAEKGWILREKGDKRLELIDKTKKI
ncbi:MAG: right-handed parallel beta-helix repeat-containing protein [Sedimentisphaerales bacterium]|nr:right-handed parallel beta-helix repeat-containing protein [Sedimentisphaerales bacterium]